MIDMSDLNSKDLEDLIIQNIPRDALMALEDAYASGDQKCVTHATLFVKDHRSSGAGQNRHFFNNENFHEALMAHGANPTRLCGTRLVIGRLGIFNIARLNVPGHKWVKIKDSKTRKDLACYNLEIERKYVQSDLFDKAKSFVANGTIFIIGVMDGWDKEIGIPRLTQVMIALPAPNLESWIYIKPLKEFIKLYSLPETVIQQDNATPILKVQPKKQTGNDQGN